MAISGRDRSSDGTNKPLERKRYGARPSIPPAAEMRRGLRAGHPDRFVVRILEVKQEARHEYRGDAAQEDWSARDDTKGMTVGLRLGEGRQVACVLKSWIVLRRSSVSP